jgi:hypothetical protein
LYVEVDGNTSTMFSQFIKCRFSLAFLFKSLTDSIDKDCFQEISN